MTILSQDCKKKKKENRESFYNSCHLSKYGTYFIIYQMFFCYFKGWESFTEVAGS